MRAGIRERLRAATDDVHQALHQAAPFARIADGSIGRAGYGALLQCLHRYHGALAPSCAAGAGALDAMDLAQAQQARLAALERDLAYLGKAVPPIRSETPQDAGFSIGCLYTVQGSTLGGKILFRQLQFLLPEANGRRFFAGTEQDGPRWRLLCDRLESQDHVLVRIEAGARHAFAKFAALLAAWDRVPETLS